MRQTKSCVVTGWRGPLCTPPQVIISIHHVASRPADPTLGITAPMALKPRRWHSSVKKEMDKHQKTTDAFSSAAIKKGETVLCVHLRKTGCSIFK